MYRAGDSAAPVVHCRFANVFTFTDYWQNTAGSFNLLVPHRELIIESKLVVRTVSDAERTPESSTGFAELENELAYNRLMLELASADSIESDGRLKAIVDEIYDPKSPSLRL